MDKTKRNISPSLWLMIAWTLAFVVVPLAYVIIISVLEKGEVWGVTANFTLDNYKKMLDPMYGKMFAESLRMGLITTGLTFLVGYPFSYFICKLSQKWRGFMVILLMAPFWINSLCRLNGWVILLKSNGTINSLLMSLGLVDEPLKLLYNFGAVVLGMVYALLPFMMLSCYNSIEKMDWTTVEAARDLGAGPIKAFFTVTLPLTMPGIIAGCVLVFIPSIGLFFVSDLLGGSKTVLLGNQIHTELTTARNWPFGAALAVVMIVATILILWLYKKISGEKGLGGLL